MTPPVVLLHALSLTSSMWHGPRAALERAGYRVLAPDLRGHGETPLGAEPESVDVLADDLAALLDHHGIEEVSLAGSSMGGYVAMAFLRRYPGRVRALALLATRATADAPAAVAGRHAFADAVLDPARKHALVAATAPALVGATTRARRRDIVEEVLESVESVNPAAVAWAQRAIAARPDSTSILRSLDVPAVVIAGEEDDLVPLAEARELARTLPGARLVEVPLAGHLTPLEAPAAVTEALLDLLGGAAVTGIAA